MYVITSDGTSDGWGKPEAITDSKEKIESFVRKQMNEAFDGKVSEKTVTVVFKKGSSGAKWRISIDGLDEYGNRYGLNREVFEVESI